MEIVGSSNITFSIVNVQWIIYQKELLDFTKGKIMRNADVLDFTLKDS